MKPAPPFLVDLVDHAARQAPEPPGADALAWEAFLAAHAALEQKLRREPAAAERIGRLLTAAHELRSEEVRWALEFIYSHLVNKYQGAVAELLAAREVTAWLSDLVAREVIGPDVAYLGGEQILERASARVDGRWLKGADGLLVVDQPDADLLVVAGVVEIKSYATRFSSNVRQLDAHAMRLRRGVRIGRVELSPEQVVCAAWTPERGWQGDDSEESAHRLLRVLVSPRASRGPIADVAPLAERTYALRLPVTSAALAAVAYELTVRFLERLGRDVFSSGSPWPEMTPEQAAINAIKENLYHVLLEGRCGSRHAERVAVRLYNVYGFGYVAAGGHRDMMWPTDGGATTSAPPAPPESETRPDAALDELIDGAWSHYRNADLEHAESWVTAALARAPDEARLRRLSWLRGMLRFYAADFAAAASLLPEPRSEEGSGIWAADVLVLIHAYTRCGQLDRAQALIDELAAAGLRWSHLPLALLLSRAWLAFARGDKSGSEVLAAEAERELAQLDADAVTRRKQTLGDPPFHDGGAVSLCALRLAALLAALGRREAAAQMVAGVERVFAPAARLARVDPAFADLEPRV